MPKIPAPILEILLDGMAREGWAGGRAKARTHVADRGGLTRGGITATAWGSYKKLGRPATATELDAITTEEALQFWYQEYCVRLGFDKIPDHRLQSLLIDWAYTSYDDPGKALQSSLKARGLYDGKIDGIVGPKTKAALLKDPDIAQLYRDVFIARLKHYLRCAWDADVQKFVADKPATQLRNFPGWMNRTLEFVP